MEEIKVRVGADIDELLRSMKLAGKSLQDFKDQLLRFKTQLADATDPASIIRLNKAIEATNAKIKLISGAGVGKGLTELKKNSDTAGQSLQNLGRIAQDAPFGFIGIQNNINPLIESFQRLKVETGSTKGALISLAKGLGGAGGLGLAVSVATGLLTVLATNGFFKSEKAADAAAEANKAYKESVEGIFANVAKEATAVNSLIAVLKSETDTRERKLAALQKLKEINHEIFNGLVLEKGAVIGVDTAYKNYLESLKTVIAAKIKQEQLQVVIEKILKAQGKTEVGIANISIDAITKQLKADNLLSSAAIGNAERRTAAKNKELRNLQNDAELLQAQLSQLSKGIEIKIPKEKTEKSAKKIVKDFKELIFTEFKDLPPIEAPIEISPFAAANFNEQLNDVLKENGNLKFNLPVDTDIDLNALENLRKKIELFGREAQGLIDNMLATTFVGIGDAIAGILSGEKGGNIFGNFFKSVLTSLGDGLTQLGVTMLAANKAIVVLKETLGKALGIPGSIAAIVLGRVISGLAQNIKVPGFAVGTRNFEGGTALVGERGPELITLPRGSSVTPSAQTANLSSGMVFIPEVVLKGQDLVIAFNRTQQSNRRNY